MMSDNDYARKWWYLVEVAHADGVPEYQTGRPQDWFKFQPPGQPFKSHVVLFDSREYAQEFAVAMAEEPARIRLGMRLEAYTAGNRDELADLLDRLRDDHGVLHVTFTRRGRGGEDMPIELAAIGIRSA